MKIASYNFRAGGFSSYSSNKPQPEYMYKAVEVVKRLDADFVNIVDTFKWDEVFNETDLKKIFNYSNVFNIKLDDPRLVSLGHDNGITLITKFKNVQFEKIELYNRNGTKTRITLGNNVLDIFGVYLDDMNEDTRIAEIKALFEYIDPDVNTIIIGDLNTFSSKDAEHINKYMTDLARDYPDVYKKFKNKIDQMNRCEVIDLIEGKGFTDVAIKYEPTTPTQLVPNVKSKGLVRVDYAFVSRQIKVKSFKVCNGDFFDTASDHYPILLDFEIKK